MMSKAEVFGVENDFQGIPENIVKITKRLTLEQTAFEVRTKFFTFEFTLFQPPAFIIDPFISLFGNSLISFPTLIAEKRT